MRTVLKSVLALISLAIMVLAFLAIRSSSPPSSLPAPSVKVDASGADAELGSLHLVENKGNRKSWELEADRAKVFQGDKMTRLRNVRVTFYSQDRPPVVVTAREGQVNMETRRVVARGNVEMTSPEGYTLKTETLSWNPKGKLVQTDDPVRIVGKDFEVTGVGLVSEVGRHTVEILKDVRAVLHSSPGR